MNEAIQEFFDSRGVALRVDREAGILRGVKILGLQSRNGRKYLPEALQEAVGLYEGAKVNVNHPKGSPLAPRDYQDRIGAIRNVVVRLAEGLFGDLHFNPKHALAEQLAWDADHAPENVGFSHNVLARTSQQQGNLVVEAITKVQSGDLVADPATTRGLFEAKDESARKESEPKIQSTPEDELTIEHLREHRPDLVDELVAEQAAELGRLRAELDRVEVEQGAQQRRVTAKALLEEFHLPDPGSTDPVAKTLVSEHFMESLLAAPSASAMRNLVEQRVKLIRDARRWHKPSDRDRCRPLSKDQYVASDLAPHEANVSEFVSAIT